MKSLLKLSGNWMILFCMFCCFQTQAQNWDLFPSNDTSYYYRYEPYLVPFKVLPYNFMLMGGKGVLEVVWVDSSFALIGGDSLFKFQPTITAPVNEECIDTSGSTIFGKQFVKTAGRISYLFNSLGDSMRIETNAPLNSTWIFYNKNGIQFQAKVDYLDTMQINGQLDSVKYISLTLVQGNVGYSTATNFILSKQHGIKESFSFSNFLLPIFPIETYYFLEPCLYKDAASLMDYAIQKYQPGNYWIRKMDSFFLTGTNIGISYLMTDTVVSSTIIPPNQIQYSLKEVINGTISYITETKTFSTNPINYLQGIYPGYYNPSMNYTLMKALGTYDFSLLSDTSSMIRNTEFPYTVLQDTCLHAQVSNAIYTKDITSFNRYFNDFYFSHYTILPSTSSPYDRIANEVLYYKLGEYVYFPFEGVPINSIQLSGQIDQYNNVKLDWVTIGEKNISGFEVQRATKDGNFAAIAHVNSFGDSEDEQYYSYTDDISSITSSSDFMYRMLVRDIDGHTSYSNSIHVETKSISAISVYPNPFISQLTIRFNSLQSGDLNIHLVDITGCLVFDQTILSANVQSNNLIQLPKDLKCGIYFLQLRNEESGLNEIFRIEKE